MKRVFLPLLLLPLLFFYACNNAGESLEKLRASADSLEKQVIEGHDIAMPKSMKIPDLQKKAQQLIDSIGKLPAKAQDSAAVYKERLEGLVSELQYADNAMDKWMNEFKLDSARDNIEARIKYLAEEKVKVDVVKEAVLNSIARADSLLKAKL